MPYLLEPPCNSPHGDGGNPNAVSGVTQDDLPAHDSAGICPPATFQSLTGYGGSPLDVRVLSVGIGNRSRDARDVRARTHDSTCPDSGFILVIAELL